MEIRLDDLEGKEIADLLSEHLQGMSLHSPPESIHALDLGALKVPEITFWSVWKDDCLTGCGALKKLDTRHAEIKSMKTVSSFLRQGVASSLLRYMLDEAASRGYQQVSLETGSMAAFEPARKLYLDFGFEFCKPFADYKEDRYSVFMTKAL